MRSTSGESCATTLATPNVGAGYVHPEPRCLPSEGKISRVDRERPILVPLSAWPRMVNKTEIGKSF